VAKRQVVEIQCDRCPRREYVEADSKDAAAPCSITFAGKTVTYQDLCSSCRKTIAAHIDGIVKKLDGKSPQRKTKKQSTATASKDPPVAPPATRSERDRGDQTARTP
jgi:hypothetical protein